MKNDTATATLATATPATPETASDAFANFDIGNAESLPDGKIGSAVVVALVGRLLGASRVRQATKGLPLSVFDPSIADIIDTGDEIHTLLLTHGAGFTLPTTLPGFGGKNADVAATMIWGEKAKSADVKGFIVAAAKGIGWKESK